MAPKAKKEGEGAGRWVRVGGAGRRVGPRGMLVYLGGSGLSEAGSGAGLQRCVGRGHVDRPAGLSEGGG